MRLTRSLEIHTYQIDFSGHVGNAVYINWLEEARLWVCREAGYSIDRMINEGWLPVLVETQIKYHRELRISDRPTLTVWISEMKGASAWMEYEIRHENGDLAAKARQRGLWVDAASRKPVRFRPEVIESFSAYLELPAESPS
ncbi:MAG: acyl-CoA thioesterase [Armatimonadetes bacterium]|nr:acyl-CoA thioesterase [Armatimonadota bacterium]